MPEALSINTAGKISGIEVGKDINNLTALLNRTIHNKFKELHTAMPGIVIEYDRVTRRAVVQGAIDRLTYANERFPRATILDVPVLWLYGAGVRFEGDLQPGDSVMLLFSMRSLDDWKECYDCSSPLYEDIMAETDAIAIPGFIPLDASEAQGDGSVWQTNDGSQYITVSDTGIELHTNSTLRVVNSVTLVSPNENHEHEFGIDDLGILFGLSEGNGLRLGPAPNTFINAATRNQYAIDNPSWLAQYNANDDHLVRVGTGTTYSYHLRKLNAWQTYTPVITGPQGMQGVTGDGGIQGIQGPAGVDGQNGGQGIQGVAGSDGAQGPQGMQGVAGADGQAGGATGPQGIQGVAGTDGADGTDGTDGAPGAPGADGTDGADGC